MKVTLENLVTLKLKSPLAIHLSVLKFASFNKNIIITFVLMPSMTNIFQVMPVDFMVVCFIHITKSTLPVIHVILSKPRVNLVVIWVTQHTETMPSVRRLALTPVNESILVL
jgi:hypothetical protein